MCNCCNCIFSKQKFWYTPRKQGNFLASIKRISRKSTYSNTVNNRVSYMPHFSPPVTFMQRGKILSCQKTLHFQYYLIMSSLSVKMSIAHGIISHIKWCLHYLQSVTNTGEVVHTYATVDIRKPRVFITQDHRRTRNT